MDIATIESLIISLQAISASIQAHDDFVREVSFTLSAMDSIAVAGAKAVDVNNHAMGAIQDTVADLQASISKGGTK